MICRTIKATGGCGQLRLQAATDTTLVNADQYYKIAGNFGDGQCTCFSVIDNNKLKYIGRSGILFVLNGTSDAAVDKACKITYALYLNGTLVPEAITIHTYAASSKISSLAITALIELNKNDTLEVYAKSDTINTKLTPNTLHITLFGVK